MPNDCGEELIAPPECTVVMQIKVLVDNLNI